MVCILWCRATHVRAFQKREVKDNNGKPNNYDNIKEIERVEIEIDESNKIILRIIEIDNTKGGEKQKYLEIVLFLKVE